MAALPSYVRKLLEGFEKDRASITSRTPMEDGMQKQLRTQSRALVKRSFILQVDSFANYQSFLTFYKDTINYGTDWFDMVDPEDGVTRLVRIVNSKLKKEEPIFGTTSWRIHVDLENWD